MASDRSGNDPTLQTSPTPDRDAEDLVFGPFAFSPKTLRLTRAGRIVPLGRRALRILAALLERPGDVIPHDALLADVWAGRRVEPDNLRVQISNLRQALSAGDQAEAYILNEPGLGYRFGVPVDRVSIARDYAATPTWRGVPEPLSRLIGRVDEVDALRKAVEEHRLTTLVGSGGAGKSAVALAAVRKMRFSSIAYLDLSVLTENTLAGALLAAFDQPPKDDDPAQTLLAVIGARRALLVLDNCDHLVEACKHLVGRVLRHTPALHILATSRKALGLAGEAVLRLYPLALPPRNAIALSEALAYPSVQLLVERAGLTGMTPDFTDADVPSLVEMCRRLDGLPLAIELAASAVGYLGLAATARSLSQHLDALSEGHRTAHPRQRTLWATFLWSYDRLSAGAKGVLAALSTSEEPLAKEAVLTLGRRAGFDPAEVERALTELLDMSLVAIDAEPPSPRYGLLQTTRVFAREMANSA